MSRAIDPSPNPVPLQPAPQKPAPPERLPFPDPYVPEWRTPKPKHEVKR